MSDQRWLRAAIRLALVFGLLAGVSVWQPFLWADALNPLYNAVTGILLPAGAIFRITNQYVGLEPVISLFVGFPESLQTGSMLLVPGTEAVLLTSAGHAAEPVIILYSIVLAWAPAAFRQKLIAFGWATIACLVIQISTVPFLLAGSFYTKICPETCLGATGRLAWQAWLHLLENGGDWAMTIASAFACIAVARR